MPAIRYHRVKNGETLEGISKAYYDSPKYAAFIYKHNMYQIRIPGLLDPGQVIAIPYLPRESCSDS